MISITYPEGSLTLKVNPYEVSFGYSLNTVDYDTAAGKVVQILSTNINDMLISSTMGASKGDMLESYRRYVAMVKFCRDLMLWQSRYNMPAKFTFPALGYDLDVFLKGQTFTDSLTNVSYPYILSFAVDQDVTGVVTSNALDSVFSKVKKGVGFVAGAAGWHGGVD